MQLQRELAPIDFKKIKEFLAGDASEEIKVCATLQALRWRLTKTRRKQLVKVVIHSYALYDLLDAKQAALESKEEDKDKDDDGSAEQPKGTILISKLLGGTRKVLEYTMTFVNALASECLGRSYLL